MAALTKSLLKVAIETKCFTRSIHTVKPVPRRALLYVPGNDLRKIEKATALNADCICLDIEDGVSVTSKDEARQTIVKVLNDRTDFGVSDVAVRINSISSGMADEDLAAVFSCPHPPPSLVVPKVDTVDEANWLADKLQSASKGFQLITQVESAEGLLNFREICATLSRSLTNTKSSLAAVIFGSDDFCASIGCIRSASGSELIYARQKIVTVAKAFKLQAIDMVDINFKDIESFRKYALEGAAMGFTGKQVIHPNQVKPAHDCFSPSAERVQWANKLVEAFEVHEAQGKGAFVFDDQMIDMPSLLQAKNIKSLADIISKRQS